MARPAKARNRANMAFKCDQMDFEKQKKKKKNLFMQDKVPPRRWIAQKNVGPTRGRL